MVDTMLCVYKYPEVVSTICLKHSVYLISCQLLCFSFTALEPFFNAAASQFVLGHQIPLSLWLSLAPVIIGNSQTISTVLLIFNNFYF